MSEEPSNDVDLKILQAAAARLMEHFSSVQIVATLNSTDRATYSCCAGAGCPYARYGATKEWVIQEEEQIAYRALKQEEEDDE